MTALAIVPDDEEGVRISAVDACAAAGVTYRALDYWTRSGLLDDDRPIAARGSGRSRTYSRRDVEIVRAVRALLDAGFTLRPAFPIARQIVDLGLWANDLTDNVRITITVRSKEHTT